MKLGIFSDVHGNIEALKTVFECYDTLDFPIDKYVCLGDIVGYGASPNECCQLVKERAAITIIGNHDAAVCGQMDYSYYYDAARKALDWHANTLREEYHVWLRSLPYMHSLGDITFSHGSPINCKEFEYVFNTHQASLLLQHWEELNSITFIGHSHLTKAFELSIDKADDVTSSQIVCDPTKKYIITVGSVGQPRDNDNRACYCVYDTETRIIDYYRIDYDVRTSAKKIFDSDLSSDFAKRLFFGI